MKFEWNNVPVYFYLHVHSCRSDLWRERMRPLFSRWGSTLPITYKIRILLSRCDASVSSQKVSIFFTIYGVGVYEINISLNYSFVVFFFHLKYAFSVSKYEKFTTLMENFYSPYGKIYIPFCFYKISSLQI